MGTARTATIEEEMAMRRSFLLALPILILMPLCVSAEEQRFGDYLSRFDYKERVKMKISSKELVSLIQEGKAQLVDIRFLEEVQAWKMGFGLHIPLNELHKRLNELDRNKIIVTACPHKDRAIMARTLLTLNGFESRYLEDGLLSLAKYLRGDRAKEFAGQAVDRK
jgi:rhodanese-related sulfurtransferase